MFATLGTTCGADGSDAAAWTFEFLFEECNVAAAVLDDTEDENGIKWYTYSVYLNYDNVIEDTLGSGNLQQLDQASVKFLEI